MDVHTLWLAGLVAALLAAGLGAGLLAGLLGVGGGIVIVPALFHAFALLDIDEAVRMHLAVGTSLATIVPTSIVSARAHWRRGSVDLAALRLLAPSVFLGALAGTVIAGAVRGTVLTALFATVALIVAANMALRPEGWILREKLPSLGPLRAIGAAIGALSAMVGIGGGTFSVPVLSACSIPIRLAVGTASAIGLMIAVPGSAGFIFVGFDVPALPPGSLGYVNLIGFALIVPATMLAAPWGARLAHVLPARSLRRAFAFFLFLTALRMFYGLLT